tara:strand:+ start:108 stop:488 length:381 start_codon:yes stop_codon:yes gene_type:complete
MEYTLYNADGSFFSTVVCSEESLTPMIPENGYYVEGMQHILSTCVNGTLVVPTSEEIEAYSNGQNLLVFREDRNAKLAKCDWTQVPDSPLSDSKKTEWQTYRQALRDMPSQEGFDPLNPVYPTKPS